MWRWLLLVVLVVGFSAIAAVVSTSLTAGRGSSDLLAFPTGKPAGKTPTGPPPKLVLDEEPHYDFGVMAQQRKGERSWVIRNEGQGPLVLTGTQPTCSCTVLDPRPGQDVTVEPGSTYTVRVEWETRTYVDKYKKDARILTNDPKRPEITFLVTGEVQPAVMTYPPDGIINAADVPNDGPHEFIALVGSKDRPETKVVDVQTTRPDLIEVKAEPLNAQEIQRGGGFESGTKVRIVVKPTPNLGAFREEVIIKTDHPLRDEVRMTVVGKVVGPVTLTPGMGVRMADVPSAKGRDGFVILTVRGQDETKIEVEKAPEHLVARVEPMDDPTAKAANVPSHRYRLSVSVKPGTPPGVIQRPIVLKTDHPMAREVQVPVYVRVLGGS